MEPMQTAAPVATFGFLDIFVVLVYLVVVTGIGLYMARGQKGKRDFFLGGRDMRWWTVGLSIVATETSALTFIGVPAMLFGGLTYDPEVGFYSPGGNMLFQQLIVGYVIARVLIAIFIVPMYYKGDVYTPYQLLTRAFGKEARYTASIIQFISISLGAGVRVFVTAIPLTLVMRIYFDNWTIAMSIFLILAVALVYTSIGGIKAVVWTDMLQFFIFVGGGLFALFYIPSLLQGVNAAPSGAEGWAAVREVSGDNMRIFASGFHEGDTIAQKLANVFTGEFNIIMGIFPQTIAILFALGFDQLNVQRVLACRDAKEGSKAMVFSAFLIFPQFLLFLLVGAALLAFYRITDFQFGVPPMNHKGEPITDAIFPVFILDHVPAVLKGFLVAGVLAAAMSSVSSALSAMGSMITMDIYRPLMGKNSNEKSELMLSRVMTLISGILLGIVAYLSMGADNVVDLAFTLASLTAGAILGAFLYGMWVKRGNPWPVVIGMATSVLFILAMNLTMRSPENPFLGLPWPFYGAIPYINWPWHTTIGITVCLLAIFATRPFFKDQRTSGGIHEEGAGE